MDTRELSIEEANEYLLGLFRALLTYPSFKSFVDDNYVIRQYYDPDSGRVLRVEITDKEGNDGGPEPVKENLH